MEHKTILSLFDHSGEWARPYAEAGHNVICVDVKESGSPFVNFEVDVMDM